MNKALKGILAGTLCCSMVLPLAACGQKNDAEERPLTLAIGAVDENFNPFFYTAQNDGEITGMTQISLITADGDANPKCGENEATAALDYRIIPNGTTSTTYEFVIKNGIKFSDGTPLTIKDVLFNLYVYLDPMYSGSSTLYSTKIKGLQAYRQQIENLDDDTKEDTSIYYQDADGVLAEIRDYDSYENHGAEPSAEMEKYLVQIAKEFEKELESDWTSCAGTVNSYKDNYFFKEDFEVFWFNVGHVGYQYYKAPSQWEGAIRTEGGYDADKNAIGKYYTHTDEGGDHVDWKNELLNALEGLTGDDREEKMKELAIEAVFNNYLTVTRDNEGNITKARAQYTGAICDILNERATGTTVRQQLANQFMTEHFEGMINNGELPVKSISGITIDRVTSFNGEMGSKLNGEHDLLRIEINGVDPVAIYNFGVVIAPMHYYSGELDGVDYVAKADDYRDATKSNRFGVAFANNRFFDEVLNNSEKTRKPMGAGVYKVMEGQSHLYSQKVARYERNTNFETVGSGLSNAKIKYLRYQYISDDQLINNLRTGTVDYATPNCTPDNVAELNGIKNLTRGDYKSNGFGYVGINPKYVKDIAIRRIIMRAMNVSDVIDSYYKSDAEVIYRPISTESWVYQMTTPQDKDTYFKAYNPNDTASLVYEPDVAKLQQQVIAAGYTEWSGKARRNPNNGLTLKFTFTIAGETLDHPAYTMFKRAADLLNQCGFDIVVQNDITALRKLATGKLAVWAAAWSSGIDPDMYQVYHKNSKATSVKNWGYDVIVNTTDPTYSYERTIINQLSDLIDEGRAYTGKEDRVPVYQQAMNLVMELAVELPTYQRKDMYVYDKKVIKASSLNQSPNATEGPLNRIWEVEYA